MVLALVLVGCTSRTREQELQRQLEESGKQVERLSQEVNTLKTRATTTGGISAVALFEEIVFMTDVGVVKVPALRELRHRGNADALSPEQNVVAQEARAALVAAVRKKNPDLMNEFAASVTSGDPVRIDQAMSLAAEAVFSAHQELLSGDNKALEDAGIEQVVRQIDQDDALRARLRKTEQPLELREYERLRTIDPALFANLGANLDVALARYVRPNVALARNMPPIVAVDLARVRISADPTNVDVATARLVERQLTRNRDLSPAVNINRNRDLAVNSDRGLMMAVTIVAVAVVVVAVAALVINYIDVGRRPGESRLIRDQIAGQIATAYKGVAYQ